jgi:hypothetical protein
MTEEIYNAEHIVKTFGHGKNQVQGGQGCLIWPREGTGHLHRWRKRFR